MLTSLLLTLAMQSAMDRPPAAHLSKPPAGRGATVILICVDRPFSWRSPLRPEPFWPLGAMAWRMFDGTVIPVRGGDLTELCRTAIKKLDQHGHQKIRRLEIWSHGGPGWFRIQRKRHFADSFRPGSPRFVAELRDLERRMAANCDIAFRTCSTFHGRLGLQFAQRVARFFAGGSRCVTLLGHTRPIAVIQPGKVVVLPGARPAWPVRDGRSEQTLEGAEIFARDILWVVTGGAYEVWRWWQDGQSPAPAAQRSRLARTRLQHDTAELRGERAK